MGTPSSHASRWDGQSRRGGQQDGVDVIRVNNGQLEFTVIPTRGMSILEVKSGDLRLGWDSPVKEVVLTGDEIDLTQFTNNGQELETQR